MMNRYEMKANNGQKKGWRRFLALLSALMLLISSTGVTAFAEAPDEDIYSDPVTAPIPKPAADETPAPKTSEKPAEEETEKPLPEEETEKPAEEVTEKPAEEETEKPTEEETEKPSEEVTDEPSEEETEEPTEEVTEEPAEEEETPEPTPEIIYNPGTLTGEADGVTVRLDYTAEACIPDDATLVFSQASGVEYYSAMKTVSKLVRQEENTDSVWTRVLKEDGNIFYIVTLADSEGNEIQPAAAMTLTVENLTAGEEYYITGDNARKLTVENGILTIPEYGLESFGYVSFVLQQTGNITLEHNGRDYQVIATYGPDAGFPAGTELKVREILPGTAEYRLYSGMTDEALNEEWAEITLERYFDITFVADGKELEPEGFVDVQIIFRDKIEQNEETEVQAVHIENNEANVIEAETDSNKAAKHDEEAIDTVAFTSDSFSVFGVVQKKKITQKVLAADGNTYEINVTYTAEAAITEGSTLKVEEIPEGSDLWEAYRKQTAAALGADDVRLPGLYDITIIDPEGNPVEPGVPVNVSIKLANAETDEDLHVVHFTEDIPQELVEAAAEEKKEEQTEVQSLTAEELIAHETITDKTVEGDTVTFATAGFSVYAFAYTVDFYYGEFEYHLTGGSAMTLSELFGLLGIEANAAEAVSVEFSNPELLAIYHITEDTTLQQVKQELGLFEDSAELPETEELSEISETQESEPSEDRLLTAVDWLLLSLKPFLSHEWLTVRMQDKSEYKIQVEDAQANAPFYHFFTNNVNYGYLDLSDKGKLKIVNGTDKYVNGKRVSFDFNRSSTAGVIGTPETNARLVKFLREDGENPTTVGKNWQGPGENADNFSGDITFVAYFAPANAKIITVKVNGLNKGNLQNTNLVNNDPKLPQYRFSSGDGKGSIITAKPAGWTDTGHLFKGWYSDGSLVSTNSEFDVSKVTADTFLTAVFEDVYRYHILANENQKGKFKIPGYDSNYETARYNLPSEAIPNEGVTSFMYPVVAEPNDSNYTFVYWVKDDGSTPIVDGNYLLGFTDPENGNALRPYYNELTRQTTYVAFFKPKNDYVVRMNNSVTGGSWKSGSSSYRKTMNGGYEAFDYYYVYADGPVLKATAESGWVFDGWYHNGEKIWDNETFDIRTAFNNGWVTPQDLNLTPVFKRYDEYFHVWFDGSNGIAGGSGANSTTYSRVNGKGELSGATSTYQKYAKQGNALSSEAYADIVLPSSATAPMNTNLTLQGWYDIYTGQYYKPGQTARIYADTVFYADWFPSNYDIGQNSNVFQTNDTSGFITTRVFDYNNLFNMPSIHLDRGSSVIPNQSSTNWSEYNKEYWHMNGGSNDFIFITTLSGLGRVMNPYDRTYTNSNNETSTNGGYFTAYPVKGLLTSNLQDRLFSTSNALGKRYLGTANYLYKYDKTTGYYYYDSDKNAASYNQSQRRFYVYNYTNSTNKSTGGDNTDFLPLNYGNSIFSDMYGAPNYWFGMSSQIHFFLPNDVDGSTNTSPVNLATDHNNREMVYKFAGDDDVWVYVDGNLVLDMGGIHGKVYGEINFSRGTWTIVSDGATKATDADGYMTYVDGTGQKKTGTISLLEGNHTLTLYYLERGASQSNCAIYFNLAPRYSLRLEKKGPGSEILQGATFGIYTDAACTKAAKLQNSETGDNTNEFTTNEEGYALCTGLAAGNTYYIKEIVPPEGYPNVSAEVITLVIDVDGTPHYTKTASWDMVSRLIDSEANADTKGQFLFTMTVNNQKVTSVTAKKTWSLYDGEKYVTFDNDGNAFEIETSTNANATATIKLQRSYEDENGTEVTSSHKVKIVEGYFADAGIPTNRNDKSTVYYDSDERTVEDGGKVSFNVTTQNGIGIYSIVATNGSLTRNFADYTTDRPFTIDGGKSNLPMSASINLRNIRSDATIYILYLGSAGSEDELKGRTSLGTITVSGRDGSPRKITQDSTFNANPTDKDGQPLTNGGVVILNRGNDWTYTWTNLQSSDGNKIYYYYVVEQSASTAQSNAIGGTAFIQTTSSDGISGGTITVNNGLKAIKVKLRKQDSERNNGARIPIAGGEFYIYSETEYQKKISGDSTAQAVTPNLNLISSGEMGAYTGSKLQADSVGRFYTGLLPEGNYYIVEENAPDGYYKLDHPIHIQVSENGLSCDMTGGNNMDSLKADSDGFYNLYIDNTKIPTTSITVIKEWANGNDKHDNDSVTIKLIRYKKTTGQTDNPPVEEKAYLTINHVADGSLNTLPAGFAATYTVSNESGTTIISNAVAGTRYELEPGTTYSITATVSGTEVAGHHYDGTTNTSVSLAAGDSKTATITSTWSEITNGSIQITQTLTGAATTSATFSATYELTRDGTQISSGSYTNTAGVTLNDLAPGNYKVEVTGSDSAYDITTAKQTVNNVTVSAGQQTTVSVSHELVEKSSGGNATVMLYINDSIQTDRISNVGISIQVPKNSYVYLSYSTFEMNEYNKWDPASELKYWDDQSGWHHWETVYRIAESGPLNNHSVHIGDKDAYCILISINSNKIEYGTFSLSRNSSNNNAIRFRAYAGMSDITGTGTAGIPSDYVPDDSSTDITIMLPDGTAWQKQIDNLPIYDQDGNVYYYAIEEVKFPNYSVEYSPSYVRADATTPIVLTATNTPTDGNLWVTKHIVGGTKTSFHFKVTLGDRTINQTFGDMTFINGVATFDLEDNQTAKATGLPSGTEYIVEETDANQNHYVTTWTGNTSGTIPANGTAEVECTNTYSYTATGSVPFTAHKTLTGGTVEAGQYSFTLTETDSTWEPLTEGGITQTVTNDGSGDAVFTDVLLTTTDTRYFTITETNTTDPSVEYDTHVQKITVSVTDDGDGNLVPSKTYDPSREEGSTYDATFINTKKGALTVTKAIDAQYLSNAADKTFTFVVTLKNTDDSNFTGSVKVRYQADTSASDVEADSEGKITLTIPGASSAYITNIPVGTKYTVEETTRPNGWNQVGDVVITGGNHDQIIDAGETEEATVTNEYAPKGTVSFKAKKIFTGGETLKDGDFEFELVETDAEGKPLTSGQGVSQTAVNAANGDVVFTDVELTSTDARYFRIAEVSGTDADEEADESIIYDDRSQFITLTVTDNEGVLEAVKAYSLERKSEDADYDIVFENIKKAKLNIKKAILGIEDGSNAVNGEYIFQILGVNDTVTADYTETVVITIDNGEMKSATIGGTDAGESFSAENGVTLSNLIPGQYTVEETGWPEMSDGKMMILDSVYNGSTKITLVEGKAPIEILAGGTAEAVFNNRVIETIDIQATKKFAEGTTADQMPTAIRLELFTYTDNDPSKGRVSVESVEGRPNPVIITRNNDTWITASWNDLQKYVNPKDNTSGLIQYAVEETGVYFGELTEGSVPAGKWIINTSDPAYEGIQISDIYEVSYLSGTDTKNGNVVIDGDTHSGSITITNEPEMTEVVVEKTWSPDFTDNKYTWSAEFNLMSDHSVDPITGFRLKSDPITASGHDSITITNSSSNYEKTIVDLPSIYLDEVSGPQKITYTVEETRYTVWYDGAVVLSVENGTVVSGTETPFTPNYHVDIVDGKQTVTVSNRKQTNQLVVKKKWMDVLPENLDNMPAVRFQLMWYYADENDVAGWHNHHLYTINGKDTFELSHPNWQWTCPVELPTTMHDENQNKDRAIRWFVKEVTYDMNNPSVDYIAPSELTEYQKQHFIVNVDGYESSQGHFSSTWQQPYYGYIEGNTGTLTIRNRCPGEYLQIDIKKKLFWYGEDGSLWTVTSDKNYMRGLVLKIQLYRRIVEDKPVTIQSFTVTGDPLNIIQPFAKYGNYMLVGYDPDGSPVGDNRGNVFEIRDKKSEGAWHWTIGNTEQNRGLPKYGFYTKEDGTRIAVRYEYLVVEEDAFKDRHETKLDDYTWYAINPALWDAVYDGPAGQIVEFERVTAQDQDRLVNLWSTNLKITKEWNVNPAGRKVYVKLYRTTNDSYDASNGSIIDVTQTGLNKHYDGFLEAMGKGATCVVDNPDEHVTTIDGQTYIVLNGNETVTIHNVEIGNENRGYRYWIQEVGYEDSTGRYLNTETPISTTYEIVKGNKKPLMNVPNDLKGKISEAIVLGQLNQNEFKIMNTVETGEMNLTKLVSVDEGKELPEGIENIAFEFRIDFTAPDNVSLPTNVLVKIDEDTNEYEVQNDNNGHYIIVNLKKGQTANISKLPIGTVYSIVETNAPGYILNWTTDKGSTGTISAVLSEAELTNTPAETDLTVIKKNSGNPAKTLAGAVFTLTEVDKEGNAIDGGREDVSAETGADGTISFTGLKVGYYKITETQAPDGYLKTNEDIIIQVVVENNVTVAKRIGEVAEDSMIEYEQEAKTVTVKNTPGVELPETGGSGTLIYTITGLALVMLAGVIFLARRKRNHI